MTTPVSEITTTNKPNALTRTCISKPPTAAVCISLIQVVNVCAAFCPPGRLSQRRSALLHAPVFRSSHKARLSASRVPTRWTAKAERSESQRNHETSRDPQTPRWFDSAASRPSLAARWRTAGAMSLLRVGLTVLLRARIGSDRTYRTCQRIGGDYAECQGRGDWRECLHQHRKHGNWKKSSQPPTHNPLAFPRAAQVS